MAELASTARGRGGDGGRGVTVARLRLRSGSRGRGSGRGGRVRERVRERSGLRGVVRGVAREAGEEAGGGQGKQEVAEAASASATPRLCSSSWQRRKRTKEEEVGWAGHLGRQVSPGEIPSLSLLSVLYFCFLFCSVLF